MNIVAATADHIPLIRNIALETWPHVYADILTNGQIGYMLDMMYSTAALNDQMVRQQHHFLMIKEPTSESFGGFASYLFDHEGSRKTKLHKLYVLPRCHGTGMGRILIDRVCREAHNHNQTSVQLNMNRQNKTLGFYQHMGFEIVGEEDIDIGGGYWMEDYVLEKVF